MVLEAALKEVVASNTSAVAELESMALPALDSLTKSVGGSVCLCGEVSKARVGVQGVLGDALTVAREGPAPDMDVLTHTCTLTHSPCTCAPCSSLC